MTFAWVNAYPFCFWTAPKDGKIQKALYHIAEGVRRL